MKPISRRRFIERSGQGVAAGSLVPSIAPALGAPVVQEGKGAKGGRRIKLEVNGKTHRIRVEDHWTLVEVLRDHLGHTGTKIGCNRGECGACTVHLDGNPIYSCSYLAVWAEGRSITTVEGLSKNGTLDPLQEAFIEGDGPQCGFCTSGQLMSAKALLNRNASPDRETVRKALAGNICRCANYNNYVDAVVEAGRKGVRRG